MSRRPATKHAKSAGLAAMENIARVFARQVTARCDARMVSTGNASLRVILAIEPGLGSEGFKITDDSQDAVRIIGNDERGLLYGVGKFLHST
jgi:alpha-glucuronidase